MRAPLVLVALLLACAGADGDDDTDDGACGDSDACDTDASDTDGGPDDTDDGGPTVHEAIEPLVPFESTRDGVSQILSYTPAGTEGLLFVFHGTGGDASVAESTEMVAVLNAMLERRIGFVATSSEDRSAGNTFDTATPPATNPDYQRLVRIRDGLIAGGVITADTPVFTLGFSAGGGFATYVANAGLADGWPVRGIAAHNSSAWSTHFREPPDVPMIWLPAEHDETVPPDGVIEHQEAHADAGNESLLLQHEEAVLEPTRFARTPFLTQAQSRDLFQLAVSEGFFDDRGARLFPVEEIETAIEAFATLPEVRYPKPVRAVLKVVLATHAINGEHAEAEADFFADRL